MTSRRWRWMLPRANRLIGSDISLSRFLRRGGGKGLSTAPHFHGRSGRSTSILCIDNAEHETPHDTQSCEMQLWKIRSVRHSGDEMSHSAQRTQEASSAQRDVTIWRCGATSGDKRRSVLLCEGVAGDAADTDNSTSRDDRMTVALFDDAFRKSASKAFAYFMPFLCPCAILSSDFKFPNIRQHATMQPQACDLRQEGRRRIRMSYAHGLREGCLSLDMIGNVRRRRKSRNRKNDAKTIRNA